MLRNKEKLQKRLRRQYCQGRTLYNPGGRALGQHLLTFPASDILETLQLEQLDDSVIFGCLEAASSSASANIPWQQWILTVQEQDHHSKNDTVLLKAIVRAYAATLPVVDISQWRRFSQSTQRVAARAIVESILTASDWVTLVQTHLTPVLLYIFLYTPSLGQQVQQLLQRLVWNRWENETIERQDAFLQWYSALWELCVKHGSEWAPEWYLDICELAQGSDYIPMYKYFAIGRDASLQLYPTTVPLDSLACLRYAVLCLESLPRQNQTAVVDFLLQQPRIGVLSDAFVQAVSCVHSRPRERRALVRCHPSELNALLGVNGTASKLAEAVLANTRLEGLSTRQQILCLLVGLAAPPSFLKVLLETYPDLCVLFLPIVVDQVAVGCDTGDSNLFLDGLDKLCWLVRNPQCAHEVWMVLAKWLSVHSSPNVRIVVIRKLPDLVETNSRLYSRVIDCLVSVESDEMKLAAIASIADLAEKDNIHDVSEVIGFVQNLLVLENRSDPLQGALVHYAILCLHFLVLNEELDFDVVVKVFNKRVCSITDHEALLALPPIVLDAVSMLLGDGQLQDLEEESKQVSPQVTAAVAALLSIGHSLGEGKDPVARRILRNVCNSLSSYSVQTLGATEEALRAAVSETSADEESNFSLLRDVLAKYLRGSNHEVSVPLVSLATKLALFEEDILGRSLWVKRGQQRAIYEESNMVGVPSVLPTQASVVALVARRHSSWCSVASLLCSDEVDDRSTLIRTHAESCLEKASEPLFLQFSIQGFLCFADSVISSSNQPEVTKLLSDIPTWMDLSLSPDAVFLILSAMSIFLPCDMVDESRGIPFVDAIFTDVMDAFQNGSFESDNVSKVCLGLVGAGCLRYSTIERLNEIVVLLEQSIRGYGAEPTFGAFYGLALIVQACGDAMDNKESSSTFGEASLKNVTCRVCAFIFDELVECLAVIDQGIISLSSSIKAGEVSEATTQALKDIEPLSVKVVNVKTGMAKYLFRCAALAFPCLGSIHGQLPVAIFWFLNSLSWGPGKGLVLVPITMVCCRSGQLTDDCFFSMYRASVLFHDSCQLSSESNDALEDALFVISGLHWLHRGSLSIVQGDNTVEGDGALLCSFVSIARTSCLGTAAFGVAALLWDNIESDIVTKVVASLGVSAESSRGSDSGDVSLVLLALLALRGETSHPPITGGRVAAEAQSHHGNSVRDVVSTKHAIDVKSLLVPLSGTVTEKIFSVVENSFSCQDSSQASQALRCLSKLSIMDEFAGVVLEPAVRQGFVRDECILFLGSQLGFRRRTFSPGEKFRELAFRLSQNLGKEEATVQSFASKLFEIIRKMDADQVLTCLRSTWKTCFLSGGKPTYTFLSSACKLLTDPSIQRKQRSTIQSFLLEEVFFDLDEGISDTLSVLDGSESIFDNYARCIVNMQMQSLEAFLRLNEASATGGRLCLRPLVVLKLIVDGFFKSEQRRQQEIGNVGAWLSKSVLSLQKKAVSNVPHSFEALRRVMWGFARAVSIEKNDGFTIGRLEKIIDVMLLTGGNNSSIALEWFSVVLACATESEDVRFGDFDLCFLATRVLQPFTQTESAVSQLFASAVESLPRNLHGLVTKNSSLSATISNELIRLYDAWSSTRIAETEQIRGLIAATRTSNAEAFVGIVVPKFVSKS